jgi:alkanesulfonate monooxygenase SsuD/methylene tetrahydromethanopterin reductase-like flavin-dependent oxidoreductase (luciferase family)
MLMTNQKSWEEYRQDVRDFNAVRADKGWAPIQPTVVVNAACFDTEAEAWEVMVRHSAEAQDSILRHYGWKDAERFRQTKGYEQYAKFSEFASARSIEQLGEHSARAQAWGTPDQVLEKLHTVQLTTSAEELVLNFRFGGMPVETAERSMRLFSTEVLGRLHELPAPLHADMTGQPVA